VEDAVAVRGEVFVAADGKVMIAFSRSGISDQHKDHQTHRAHAGAIDQLVTDKILGEDTVLETARGAVKDIRLSLLET
jgi:hypothetical protein